MAPRQPRPLNYLVDSKGRVKGVIVPIKEYERMKDGRLKYEVVVQRLDEIRRAVPAITRKSKAERSGE